MSERTQLSKYEELGEPGEPDYWEPKTKTEHELLKNMEEERRLRPLLFRWMGSEPPTLTCYDIKEIIMDHQSYRDFRRRGYTSDSDLDLELLLAKVRQSIVTFEDMAEHPENISCSGRELWTQSKGS